MAAENCIYTFKGEDYKSYDDLKEAMASDPDTVTKYRKNSGRFAQEELSDELSKDIVNMETTYNNIVARIKNIHELHRPKSAQKRSAEKVKVQLEGSTPLSRLEDLDSVLDEFNETNKILGMVKYVQWSRSYIKNLESRIERSKEAGTLNKDLILKLKEFNSAFELMEDVEKIILSDHSDFSEKKGVGGKTRKETWLEEVRKVKDRHQAVNSELLIEQRKIYADIMSKNSTQHLTDWRNKFSIDFETVQPDMTKLEYVNSKMIEHADAIQSAAYNEYLKQAEESFQDISNMEATFITEKNLNSGEIQIASRLIDAADMEVDMKMKTVAQDFKKAYDEFSKDNPGSNLEEKYSKFIEEDSNGDRYLVGRYSPSFLNEENKQKDIAGDQDKFTEVYKNSTYSGNYYTVNGVKKKFAKYKDALKGKVEGDYYTYMLKGKKIQIPVLEAIARSEYLKWRSENMAEGNPKAKWLNPKFTELSNRDKEHLLFLTNSAIESDDDYDNNSPLVRSFPGGAKFVKIPQVQKSKLERFYAGDMKGIGVDIIGDLYKRRADDFETAENKDTKPGFKRVFADISSKEKGKIPIPFSAPVDKADQSLDLHTIFLMNKEGSLNYNSKFQLEKTLVTMADVMTNRLTPQRAGLSKVQKLHGISKDQDLKLYIPKDELPNDVKKVLDMIENRIYGIKNKDAGEVAGVNVQKAAKTYLGYASSTALIGNYLNSIVNATTGTVNNIIEAIGGDVYTLKDWREAGSIYWKDAKNIISDVGSNVQVSRTNVLLDGLNVLGSREALANNFEENNRIKTLFKTNSLRPLATMGEHMMQSKVMYAILNNIKITNKEGKYLDSDGKVVDSKDKAQSLNDAIIVSKNKNGTVEMKLAGHAKYTTFSPDGGDIMLEARNLIKKKIIDLHGNYDNDLQSAAQREWWGKIVFFLRKWIEPTVLRRWRGFPTALKSSEELRDVDRFYSEDLKAYQEGYYITATRFIAQLVKAGKEFNFELIRANFDKLSASEKANIRKIGMEFGMIGMTMLAYMAAGGFDDDPEDETLMARYLLRREISELSFYANPMEAIKIGSTPTATIGVIKRNMKVFSQLFSPTERYKTGKNKDELKLWVRTKKSLPGFSQYEKDLEASLRFLQSMD